jgi:hypothetical protein
MSSKLLAGITPEPRKKQRIKVQLDIVARSIDELPSKYSDSKKGELFIEYKKGSGSKNKGTTKLFKPTGSKQMTLNADLSFSVNLTKDLATGTFDKKIVIFSLKFVSTTSFYQFPHHSAKIGFGWRKIFYSHGVIFALRLQFK